LCVHGRRQYDCVDCGGAGICVHKRLKHNCSICKAGGKGKIGAGQGSGRSGGHAGGGGGDVSGGVRKQGTGIAKTCADCGGAGICVYKRHLDE
jgi:hypothetical protein